MRRGRFLAGRPDGEVEFVRKDGTTETEMWRGGVQLHGDWKTRMLVTTFTGKLLSRKNGIAECKKLLKAGFPALRHSNKAKKPSRRRFLVDKTLSMLFHTRAPKAGGADGGGGDGSGEKGEGGGGGEGSGLAIGASHVPMAKKGYVGGVL